jgi:hypothetical protein
MHSYTGWPDDLEKIVQILEKVAQILEKVAQRVAK